MAHDWDKEIKLRRRQGDSWVDWRTLPGHDGPLNALAFHPSGAQLASAGRDGALKIWRCSDDSKTADTPDDSKQDRLFKTLLEHDAVVECLAYSPGGDRLYSGDANGVIRVWDAHTYVPLDPWSAHKENITALALAPDGSELASASTDGSIVIWDLRDKSRRHVLRGHAGHANGLAYSPDGKRIASCGSEGDINLWDPVSGHTVLTLRQQIHDPSCVRFASDGERLFAYGGNNLKIWDARDPALQREQRLRAWHSVEAAAADKKGRHRAALFHFSCLLDRTPEDADLLLARAWAAAECGDWDQAKIDILKVAHANALAPTLVGNGFRNAWLLTTFGPEVQSRKIAARILDTYENTPDPFRCYLTGVLCGFRSNAVDQPARLVAMMRRAVDKEPGKSYFWEVLAVAHLRAGQWREAIAAAEKVRTIEKNGRGIDSFVEALAYHHLGNRDLARECYECGRSHLADHGDYERRSQTRYFDFLCFQREAAQALELPLPPLRPLAAVVP